MSKDNMDAAKLELISQLLSSQSKEEKPGKSKDLSDTNKPKQYVHRSAFVKSEKTKAKREKSGQAELRKAMKKPRSEELKPKT